MAAATKHRTTTKTAKLAKMPPEAWGWKLRRAREQVAHLTSSQVADTLSQLILIDPTSITRLEKFDEIPVHPRRRQTAYLCAMIYGIDPAEFGLTDNDVPPGLRAAARDLGFAATGWFTRTPAQPKQLPRAG